MIASVREAISERAGASEIQSVLLIGAEAVGLFQPADRDCTLQVLTGDDIIERLQDAQVYDLAIVAGLLERLDKTQARTVLSRVRDLYAKRMIVVVRIGLDWGDLNSHWEPAEMTALGMNLCLETTDNERKIHLYEFDITRYKTTPKWLNAKYWANPEYFGKYRW